MEVKIGVQNVVREVLVDTDDSSEDVIGAVNEALSSGSPLVLTDTRGQRIIVPAAVIGYVEVSGEPRGRVGFGG